MGSDKPGVDHSLCEELGWDSTDSANQQPSHEVHYRPVKPKSVQEDGQLWFGRVCLGQVLIYSQKLLKLAIVLRFTCLSLTLQGNHRPVSPVTARILQAERF